MAHSHRHNFRLTPEGPVCLSGGCRQRAERLGYLKRQAAARDEEDHGRLRITLQHLPTLQTTPQFSHVFITISFLTSSSPCHQFSHVFMAMSASHGAAGEPFSGLY